MGKSEGDSGRKPVYVSIGLSLGIGFILGGIILFLELKSAGEIASLRNKVIALKQEIITLQHNLQRLNNSFDALDTKERSSKQTSNDAEYDEYDAEEYDDPNEDSYEDDEEGDSYDNAPSPSSNTDAKLSSNQPHGQNDTRPKRESNLNSEILTKDFYPHRRVINNSNKLFHQNRNKEMAKENQANKQKAFNKFDLLQAELTVNDRQQSLSNENKKINFTSLVRLQPDDADNIQLVKTSGKQKRHLKGFNSELQTTNQMLRLKRGGRQEDVEVFDRPEFPNRSNNNHEIVAAHFGADESKCKNTRHRHCDYNDRRFHPQYHLKDWQSTSWMNQLSTSSSFNMRDGVLIVQNSGLYFIYAQVFYADAHDVCGFRILQNGIPILQCTTTSNHDASKNSHKRNSCFTGSLVHLQTGDELKILETEENRYTFFEKTKSFFGLFKVGNVR